MTPEQLDEATAREARRLWITAPQSASDSAVIAARLAREGWTPPEPEVDRDVLAYREWAAGRWPVFRGTIILGSDDYSTEARAFLAGARMAREQERERAKPLLEFAEDIAKYSENYGVRARRALAKYQEGGR